jgi:hypothetical protein
VGCGVVCGVVLEAGEETEGCEGAAGALGGAGGAGGAGAASKAEGGAGAAGGSSAKTRPGDNIKLRSITMANNFCNFCLVKKFIYPFRFPGAGYKPGPLETFLINLPAG